MIPRWLFLVLLALPACSGLSLHKPEDPLSDKVTMEEAEAGVAEEETTAIYADIQDAFRLLRRALDLYREDHGAYPTGLDALAAKPGAKEPGYLDRIPADPWGRDFRYVAPTRPGAPILLFTLGRDARPGGAGLDSDVRYEP